MGTKPRSDTSIYEGSLRRPGSGVGPVAGWAHGTGCSRYVWQMKERRRDMGNGRSLLLLPESLLGAALLAASSVAGAEQSAAPTFRTGTVRLYDCKDTAAKVVEHPKGTFPSPWRVVPNSPTTPWPNGFVRIEMPDKE